MPVLTKKEISMVSGEVTTRIPGTFEEIQEIERKLSDFQKSITDEKHIESVNSFIDLCYIEAGCTSTSQSELCKTYHQLMNEKTQAAGLRQFRKKNN